MKKRMAVSFLAVCLLLSGCASLLERSYSVVEPYADRYWDASAEDTLRVENYQDLVNSLLMLIEERAEDGVIRYYTEGDAYGLAQQATKEVKEETMLGSYLLGTDSRDIPQHHPWCSRSGGCSFPMDLQFHRVIDFRADVQHAVG